LHDNTGYTPYAGRELKGWPVTVLSRGEVLVDAARPGEIAAARGRGRFIARSRTDALVPAGRQIPEMAQLTAWNTPLAL
jgi:dihydropyrimidinase